MARVAISEEAMKGYDTALEDLEEEGRLPPLQLVAMRHIADHGTMPSEGRASDQYLLKLFQEDFPKFNRDLATMEKAHRVAVASLAPREKGAEAVVEDEGTEKCLELVERILAEYDSEAGKQS